MRDLFGEVPISRRELELWLYTVPRLPHSSERRTAYATGYNIIYKIQREKLSGRLAETFGDEACPFCGQRLCSEQADIPPGIPPTKK